MVADGQGEEAATWAVPRCAAVSVLAAALPDPDESPAGVEFPESAGVGVAVGVGLGVELGLWLGVAEDDGDCDAEDDELGALCFGAALLQGEGVGETGGLLVAPGVPPPSVAPAWLPGPPFAVALDRLDPACDWTPEGETAPGTSIAT